RVADDAVQLRAGQTQTVHALKLKRVFHARLEFRQRYAALDVETIKRAPALAIRLDPQLRADGGRDKRGERTRIHDEVRGSLAIYFGADQDMLRVGDLIRDLIGFGLDLLRLIGTKRRDQENRREAGAVPHDSHAKTTCKGRTLSIEEGCDPCILIIVR